MWDTWAEDVPWDKWANETERPAGPRGPQEESPQSKAVRVRLPKLLLFKHHSLRYPFP